MGMPDAHQYATVVRTQRPRPGRIDSEMLAGQA
jgi:hypothetical protein